VFAWVSRSSVDHHVPLSPNVYLLTVDAFAAHSIPMSIHQFSFPTAITFGPGARKQVSAHLETMRVKRPLVVTDRGIAALPLLDEFTRDLEQASLKPAVFSGVWGNPTADQVRAGTNSFRAHQADAVVAVGGGAALDVGKAVALMAAHPGDVMEYAFDHPQRRAIQNTLPYFIALPTTSGTGSEVGRSAVISDDATHVKKIVFAPALLARAVFADPELTLGLPPKITAATGIDALTHNIESYLSPVYHPLCDGVALEGVRIAARALPLAFRDGANVVARTDMMMSSMMGAIAFQKDLGAVHSCAHALGTVLDVHHGLANGVMLDHVMRFNLPSAREKMSELARVAAAGATGEEYVTWLTRLKQELGIPSRLSELGAKPEHIGPLVAVAIKDSCHQTNPRPCNEADFDRLFRDAL
jgi:alcohol dehydrogenase class IV